MEKTLRLLTDYKKAPQWVVNGGADHKSVELLDKLNSDQDLKDLLTVIGGLYDRQFAADGSYTGFKGEEDRENLRKALSSASEIVKRIAGEGYDVKDESVLP